MNVLGQLFAGIAIVMGMLAGWSVTIAGLICYALVVCFITIPTGIILWVGSLFAPTKPPEP